MESNSIIDLTDSCDMISDIKTFKVIEGLVTVNVDLIRKFYQPSNIYPSGYNKVDLVRILIVAGFDGKRLSLKSAKNIVEHIFGFTNV